ncbi:hypothetical protein F511_43443 [Dorcoceras hygrometricum]|uniref:Uncharacterized protein n=1 Tax=Dorcoceras hygrometricum TaxID=472368 RepID=A0A2Z7AK94_9LAMI|nr:hypothetical protein F511_43443 [Dorcoceras hygrometricum]
MRIRPPELETSVCDTKYHVSLSTRCVLGKWVYLVTHAMSLFDLRDVCIVIGSLETLDLPMIVDLIGIYVLKGPYCTLTRTDWFLQALSVIPRGSWGDVARRFTIVRWMDSDLVIYRTTLVRTFQVVTICRVDRSDLISDRNYDEATVIEMKRMFIWTWARPKARWAGSSPSLVYLYVCLGLYETLKHHTKPYTPNRRPSLLPPLSAARPTRRPPSRHAPPPVLPSDLFRPLRGGDSIRDKFVRSVVELEEKPAVTQIQQQRKFSSDANSAATQIQQLAFSDADFIFSTKIQISRREARLFVQETPPVEILKDFPRVQGRFHAVTVEWRELMAN